MTSTTEAIYCVVRKSKDGALSNCTEAKYHNGPAWYHKDLGVAIYDMILKIKQDHGELWKNFSDYDKDCEYWIYRVQVWVNAQDNQHIKEEFLEPVDILSRNYEGGVGYAYYNAKESLYWDVYRAAWKANPTGATVAEYRAEAEKRGANV